MAMHLSRVATVVSWVLQLVVAGILLQTLFFKFTGAAESVYIFASVGQYVGVPAVEPWGRIGSGVVELVASVLLLVPGTAVLGAMLAMGVMAGAIASHLLVLGIDVQGDGGLLFALALVVFVGSAIVLVIRRSQVPLASRLLGTT
jgi:putative oxidoreductase